MSDQTEVNDKSRAEWQSLLNAGLGEPAINGHFTIYRHFDGMCWPAQGTALCDLEWTLRYGDSERQRFVAASVISAYKQLIAMPEKKRNLIIKELRKGPGKESPNATKSDGDRLDN